MNITAEEALGRLRAGNARFVSGNMLRGSLAHPALLRHHLAEEQHPYAVILGCSDSRVPPEIVFDETLGDIFVVRGAGHVVDEVALGSIEYAVEHLAVPLILVLGHERCGAVTAAVEGGEQLGHISVLTAAITPAVEATQDVPGDRVENALQRHAKNVAASLQLLQPILAEKVAAGELRVIAARYDLETGIVTPLE